MTFQADSALPPTDAAATSPVAPFWVLGIDPGSKGAVAALRSDLSAMRILKMPMLERSIDLVDVEEFFTSLRSAGDIRHAVIEKSQVMPNQGASSGFVYGRNYGTLTAALHFSRVPFTEVSPAKWKGALINGTVKLPGKPTPAQRAAHKKALKALAILTAQRMFPFAGPFKKSEDGPAEASLLAEASRRIVLHGSMGNGKTEFKGEDE